MQRLALPFFILLAVSRAHSFEFDRHEKWHMGNGLGRGHEDLTRWAVEEANLLMKAKGQHQLLFPEVAYGEDAETSANPIIRGNYATDYPDARMRAHYEVPPQATNWHTLSRLQNLHFLRNAIGSEDTSGKVAQFESKLSACEGGKKLIVKSTQLAMRSLDKANQEEFFYWTGHALHIIQDGFSPAHSQREAPSFKRIIDQCTYGKQIPGVCYHEALSLKDRIWRWSPGCLLGGSREMDCLKEEARAAVTASVGFLLAIGDILEQRESGDSYSNNSEQQETRLDVLTASVLDRYFTGNAVQESGQAYQGFFSCD